MGTDLQANMVLTRSQRVVEPKMSSISPMRAVSPMKGGFVDELDTRARRRRSSPTERPALKDLSNIRPLQLPVPSKSKNNSPSESRHPVVQREHIKFGTNGTITERVVYRLPEIPRKPRMVPDELSYSDSEEEEELSASWNAYREPTRMNCGRSSQWSGEQRVGGVRTVLDASTSDLCDDTSDEEEEQGEVGLE